MRHLDLFAGIGGFSLAARMAGWETVAHCEINPYCQQVLHKHFPNAKLHADIKELDGTQYRGTVDIITGGFPCQPYSLAGKRRGKDDERHLWPEMRRVYREVAPSWIVGENVRGLVNWNGGLVFEEVQADLESDGYEVIAGLLPAAGVSAPHKRDRVWFVAHTRGDGYQRWKIGGDRCEESKSQGVRQEREWFRTNVERTAPEGYAANPNDVGLQGRSASARSEETGGYTQPLYALGDCPSYWDNFPTKSGVCRGNDGVPNRVDRIKALGNAIVPQVSVQIFKAINQYNSL